MSLLQPGLDGLTGSLVHEWEMLVEVLAGENLNYQLGSVVFRLILLFARCGVEEDDFQKHARIVFMKRVTERRRQDKFCSFRSVHNNHWVSEHPHLVDLLESAIF